MIDFRSYIYRVYIIHERKTRPPHWANWWQLSICPLHILRHWIYETRRGSQAVGPEAGRCWLIFLKTKSNTIKAQHYILTLVPVQPKYWDLLLRFWWVLYIFLFGPCSLSKTRLPVWTGDLWSAATTFTRLWHSTSLPMRSRRSARAFAWRGRICKGVRCSTRAFEW